MGKYVIFMNKKIQYCQDGSPSQFDLQILCNPKQNPRKLTYVYQQMDYIETQKTQNSQLSIEEQEPSWSTNTT